LTGPRRPAGGRDAADLALLGALGLLAALLLLKTLDSAQTMAAFFNWPFQFDESESMIVAETLLWDRGVDIYGPLTPQQFIAAPYPPLYYLLNLPFIHALGATFKPGRAISLLATVAVAALLYGIAAHVTRDRLAGALGALAWGAIGIVAFWGSLVKPDMLAVACGLGGLWWALHCVEGGRGSVWWALPCFWAAFYSKQTAIAAAVAVCVWLILWRWRTGLAFTAAYAAGAAGGYVALDALTGGGYFYHEFTVHDLPWNAERFAQRLSDWGGAYWPLLAPGALGVALLLLWHGGALLRRAGGPGALVQRAGALGGVGAPGAGVLLAGYLGMSLITASGAGTLGGNHNHLLDLTAACCLGLALLAGVLRAAPGRAWRAGAAAGALALAALTPGLYATPHWLGHELRVPVAQDEGMRNIAQYTSNTPGPVYSTNLSVLLVTDKWKLNLWTTDPYTQTHATANHRWDESALLAAIRSGYFSLVILRFSLDDPQLTAAGDLSPGLLSAVRESYHLDQRNVLYLYKPNTAR
jgi:hypothetical protein